MKPAPIALFAYNRPHHTLRVLQGLKKNRLAEKSHLYIFCDGPKNEADHELVEQVRKAAASERWCGNVEVVARDKNRGLAASIVGGVTELVNAHGTIIVLEDDLVPSAGFLEYTNQALNLYASREHVMHISGYMYPHLRKPFEKPAGDTFFVKFMACWGWATWARAWKTYSDSAPELLEKIRSAGKMDQFNLDGATHSLALQLMKNADGTLNSWAIKWYASIFLNDGLCLFPGNSLVRNIGNDGTGTHPDKTDIYSYQKIASSVRVDAIPVEENLIARNRIKNFFHFLEKRKTIPDKVIEKLRLLR